MTQTIQPRSLAYLNNTKKTNIPKPKTDDNLNLLFQLLDNMNDLYKALCRLNYAIDKRIMEQNLYQKDKELSK